MRVCGAEGAVRRSLSGSAEEVKEAETLMASIANEPPSCSNRAAEAALFQHQQSAAWPQSNIKPNEDDSGYYEDR